MAKLSWKSFENIWNNNNILKSNIFIHTVDLAVYNIEANDEGAETTFQPVKYVRINCGKISLINLSNVVYYGGIFWSICACNLDLVHAWVHFSNVWALK